eukprot:m.31245 g.31245  ORF g.31245 m.31245 type:complete len:913 (-) comp4786_c0_seq1:252-2990(-)
MSSLSSRMFNGIRLFLSGEPPQSEGGPDAGSKRSAPPTDDDDGSSSDSTSESAASSSSSSSNGGTASASVTPAHTPAISPSPSVMSPLVLDCTPFALDPFPAPPPDESPYDRSERELGELQEALMHLHAEMCTVDSADARVFLEPVDDTYAPCYHEVIKTPMDLSTIGGRIAEGHYATAWEYMDDFQLMIDNCLEYNKAGTFHNRYAQKFLKMWTPKVEHLCLTTLVHHDYCCGKRRTLSGFAYRCRGGTCFIRYGCVFWAYDPNDGEDELVYCQSHYQRLPAEVTIPRYGNGTGGDVSFKKTDLTRHRHNTPLVSENFVTCVECGHRDHEICKMHQSWISPVYHCSRCQKLFGVSPPPVPSPRSLPESHLSRALEQEASCKVPLVGHRVCIRVVDQDREKVEVKPMMRSRYPECVSEFNYTKKVVLCFMDIEGTPVCFFGMILHEYGEDCAEPNKGRCYLSLLDSVKLPKTMLPSAYRTAIYHAVVRGYLREAGRRGFKACHIYTCPPRKGQNYIFPFKPDDQKEISIIRLRKWYADILTHSQICEPPAIVEYKNIGDVYPKPGLTEIPYFDGDNWPDILEDIIKIDEKIRQAEKEREENRKRVEALAAANTLPNDKAPKHKKPETKMGHFAGTAPPKKRRKTEQKRPPKPKLTVEGRLHVVMSSSKRDFLVVELVRPKGKTTVDEDPDANVKLAKTGNEHTVGTFLRTEKLEFSSLRHAKFSTMLLVHALLSDTLPPERYPDTKDGPHSTRANSRGPARSTTRSRHGSHAGSSQGDETTHDDDDEENEEEDSEEEDSVASGDDSARRAGRDQDNEGDNVAAGGGGAAGDGEVDVNAHDDGDAMDVEMETGPDGSGGSADDEGRQARGDNVVPDSPTTSRASRRRESDDLKADNADDGDGGGPQRTAAEDA